MEVGIDTVGAHGEKLESAGMGQKILPGGGYP